MRVTTMSAERLSAASHKDADHRRRQLAGLLRDYFLAERHLRQGICLLNAGRHADAIVHFTRATEFNPGSATLPRILVNHLCAQGQYDNAVAPLQEQIALEPEDAEAHIRLALCLWKTGHARRAIHTLRRAVRHQPENAELHFQLGTLLAAVDNNEEAELRFTQAIAIDKQHADALAGLGMCAGARGDIARAVDLLQRAQQFNPHDARIGMLLACAARSAPGASPVRVTMPAVMRSTNDPALDQLSRRLEADLDTAESLLYAGEKDEQIEVAEMLAAAFGRATERNPHRADLHLLCGAAHAQASNLDAAIAVAERAVELDRRLVEAQLLLARLYAKQNRHADAAARLEETLLLGAEFADTYFTLGNIYRTTGQVERARWAYENALRINNDYTAAQHALAGLAA